MNSILEQLETIQEIGNKKIAVLIRHGEREKIPDGQFGADCMLTENGVREALAMGENLKQYKIVKILTSPIPRCVQTSELLRKGMGKDLEIIKDTHLGDPGFHISNGDKAGRFYLEYGSEGVYERFAAGEGMDGISDIDFLRGSAVDWLKSQMHETGVTLFVTHDALIAHFAYANGIKKYTRENWVEYLDGIVVEF